MRDIEEDWAASGLAALSTTSGGSFDVSRAPVLAYARHRLAEFTAATASCAVLRPNPSGAPDVSTLLAGRAGLLGLTGRGRISANGTTHLISSAHGWWALTLSRPDDVAAVPALLEAAVADEAGETTAAWAAVHHRAPTRSADEWVARARLLDLPAAVLGEAGPGVVREESRGRRRERLVDDDLLVVDLSSLWAGPLSSRLLADAGATVVKVESRSRPDGSRSGNADFFRWMNHGKLSYTVDFHRERDDLERLLRAADVVIEGSRPRALRRLGLGPEELDPPPGQVWVRITGHGTDGDKENWTGFGDDAAVAGGLVGRDDGPIFCGDAIADPLTGIEVALAISRALEGGGARLVEKSLASTAALYAQQGSSAARPVRRAAPPRPPEVLGPSASELGADNGRVEDMVARRLNSV